MDIDYDYFEKDNAIFRRPKGIRTRSVHDVYRPDAKSWVPYEGDRLAPVVFGSKTVDPMAESIYEYFDYDNAFYRRAHGKAFSPLVDDVLIRGKWVAAMGDRLAPAMFGDRTDDPLAHSQPRQP